MIHTYLVLTIAAIALVIRWQWHESHSSISSARGAKQGVKQGTKQWSKQWWWTLTALALPPLWLLNGLIAVLLMGTGGTMWGRPVGALGSVLAVGGLGWAIAQLIIAWYQGQQSIKALQTLPTVAVQHLNTQLKARLIEQPLPYAAQVGFWRSQLVISEGFLTQLSPEQIQAVLAHEAAHAKNHDTFVFFWLGWLHRLVAWLPGSQQLWQELLLLREIRADRQAAQTTDPLDVAEALLLMAKFPLQPAAALTTGMDDELSGGGDRLDRRIQSLIQQTQEIPTSQPASGLSSTPMLWSWGLMGIAACPLLVIALHH